MAHKKDFNYRITEFFLNNTRLTILSLFLLLVIGAAATFSLKTVGFPNPEIKFTLIQTVYPGADSNTVLEDVTKPLEDSLDDIDGIESYQSNTLDSFSSISVGIEQDASKAEVDADIQAAVNKINLPDNAENPELVSPEIGGPDILLSVYNSDLATRYEHTQELINYIEELSDTESVEQINELGQEVVLLLDDEKLDSTNITQEDIERAITTSNESLPVVSQVLIDDTVKSVVTNIEQELTFDNLLDLQVYPSTSANSASSQPGIGNTPAEEFQSPTALGDLGSLELLYGYDGATRHFGIKDMDGEVAVLEVAALNIKTKENVDQISYFEEIVDFVEDSNTFEYADTEFPDTDKTVVVNNYTVADENSEQVNEVLGGLFGGPLDIDNGALAQVGWLLGGIQLVFLVMLLFVSWRAAIIAAASIPLSLVFTNIYLLLIGENLNTLVLFSFVLVIGLVVDPALVILESIQRKIDTGLRGKEAALAAIRDVGTGLFLATLTNIIVFSPFGLVSGILGQIFAYIPLTIIPAVIGSYIVPLVFLAWIGGYFMRKGKNTSTSEEENLWPLAKWLIKMNHSILHGWRIWRLLIIAAGIVLPLVITGFYFSTGQVKQVQFASGDNPPFMTLDYEFLAGISNDDKRTGLREAIEIVTENEAIEQVYPSDDGVWFGNATDVSERRDYTLKEAVDDINDKFADSDLDNYFFDISTDVAANGPPEPLYQVQIAVKSDDLALIQEASLEVGETLGSICEVDGSYLINDCDGKENLVVRVDDGYTDRVTQVISFDLNRELLAEQNLIAPQGPASIIVNSNLRESFPQDTNDDAVSTVTVDGEEKDLFIRGGGENANSLDSLRELELTNTRGETIPVQDVAELVVKDAQSQIRRVQGETVNVVQIRLQDSASDQGSAAQIGQAVEEYYSENDFEKTKELGLEEEAVGIFSEGGSAEFLQSFNELLISLVLAIVFSYFVLAIFFNSLTQPFTILYTIPLTFIGIFPAIGHLSNGQFGLLEIIGLIILVGIVENVAIFLLDSANQSILEGKDPKEAISLASGIRLRPVILTNLTATASLAPLAFLSETYRPLSLVIIFGLMTSGLVSLITTPILFIFFRWVSYRFGNLSGLSKVFFFPFFPIYIIVWGLNKAGDEFMPSDHSEESLMESKEDDGFFKKKAQLDTSKMKNKKK